MKIRRPHLERGFIILKCTDLTKPGVGRIVIHSYRVIGKVKAAYYFPEGPKAVRYEVPKKSLRNLMKCQDVREAIDVLYWA